MNNEKNTIIEKSDDYDEDNGPYALYCRVSKDNGTNVETYVRMLKEFMIELRITNYIIIVDVNYKGSDPNRPGLDLLKELVDNEKVTGVVAPDISRLGRNKEETVAFVNKVKEKGIALKLPYNNIDSHNGIDMDEIERLAKEAEEYSQNISLKISRALKVRVDADLPLYHGNPYGYVRDKDNKYQLIPDTETAGVVEAIFNLYCDLKSLPKVADKMTEMKIIKPSSLSKLRRGAMSVSEITDKDYKWDESTIRGILKNELYIGNSVCMSYSKYFPAKKLMNTHTPIIDKELFDKVQAILSRRSGTHNT